MTIVKLLLVVSLAVLFTIPLAGSDDDCGMKPSSKNASSLESSQQMHLDLYATFGKGRSEQIDKLSPQAKSIVISQLTDALFYPEFPQLLSGGKRYECDSRDGRLIMNFREGLLSGWVHTFCNLDKIDKWAPFLFDSSIQKTALFIEDNYILSGPPTSYTHDDTAYKQIYRYTDESGMPGLGGDVRGYARGRNIASLFLWEAALELTEYVNQYSKEPTVASANKTNCSLDSERLDIKHVPHYEAAVFLQNLILDKMKNDRKVVDILIEERKNGVSSSPSPTLQGM